MLVTFRVLQFRHLGQLFFTSLSLHRSNMARELVYIR